MTAVSEQQILDALRSVEDPDLKRDIVSLGFIKNLRIEGDPNDLRVLFDVELTSPASPIKEQLRNQCRDAILALGVAHVDIRMTARVRSVNTRGKQPIPGVRNLIAVASGKGGVGKSTVAMNLALSLAQSGAAVGLLDCDFYGPSLPAMVGLYQKVDADKEKRLIPHELYDLKLMSMGFLIDRYQPVTWRGPMLHKMLQNFLFGTVWGELDYLIMDLPPGTGDVQLSITGSTPLSAAVLVSTPQEVALRDVDKGLRMFQQVQVPVLGIIANMAYYLCGQCDKRHAIFGDGLNRYAAEVDLPLLGELPLDTDIPSGLGRGEPLLTRTTTGPAAEAIREVAGRLVAELSKLDTNWAVPGPGAMEV